MTVPRIWRLAVPFSVMLLTLMVVIVPTVPSVRVVFAFTVTLPYDPFVGQNAPLPLIAVVGTPVGTATAGSVTACGRWVMSAVVGGECPLTVAPPLVDSASTLPAVQSPMPTRGLDRVP